MADAEFKTPGLVGPLKKKALGPAPPVPEKFVDGAEPLPDEAPTEKDVQEEPKVIQAPEKPVSDRQSIPEARAISRSDREKYEKIFRDLNEKYKEPLGSAPADSRYSLEVLKTGTILDRVTFQSKKYFVVGRVPGCDILAEHPTISRLHAIFQFIDAKAADEGKKNEGDEEETQAREKGLYIYDIGSTHGTFLNKNRIHPNRFYRLRVGHVVKFGNSTRLYIVCGPADDEEEESEKTVTELLKERTEKELERKRLEAEMEQKIDIEGRDVEEEGISWGMAEDAEEETDLAENPFAMDFQSSELVLDNPKKTLRGWFEREGYDLEYDVREKAAGHFICRIELPLDRPDGGKVFAEVELKGKKKEVVHQCALQACQILDKYGVLRQAHHESRVQKRRDWEDQDYYSSDEDTFLDRTGTVEKKREKRMMAAGKIQPKVETYESLLEKSDNLAKEIASIKEKIAKIEKASAEEDEVDPLDAFMSDLKTGSGDIKKLKTKLRELTAEQLKTNKLLNIAKPSISPLPPVKQSGTTVSAEKPFETEHPDETSKPSEAREAAMETGDTKPKKPTAVIGPRVQFKVASRKMLPERPKEIPKPEDSSSNAEEEEEEDDNNVDTPARPAPPVKPTDESKALLPERPPVLPEVPEQFTSASVTASEEMEVNPEDDEDEEVNAEPKNDGESSSSKSRGRKRTRNRNKEAVAKEMKYDYDVDDPKYSIWVPPSNQKGDGKTSLNEKLGY